MPSAPLVLTMRTTRAEHQHIGWIWIESCNCYTKRAIPNSFLEFDMALFCSINPLAELNQCVLDPAYRLVANVVDVL